VNEASYPAAGRASTGGRVGAQRVARKIDHAVRVAAVRVGRRRDVCRRKG